MKASYINKTVKLIGEILMVLPKWEPPGNWVGYFPWNFECAFSNMHNTVQENLWVYFHYSYIIYFDFDVHLP